MLKYIIDENTRIQLMAMTFKNLGFLFKQMDQVDESIKYYYKVTDIAKKAQIDSSLLSDVYLNIAEIESGRNKHEEALEYALKTIKYLKFKYLKNSELTRNLVMGFLRAGVEYQNVNMQDEAESNLRKALDISRTHFGFRDTLTLQVKRALSTYTTRLKPQSPVSFMQKYTKRPKSQESVKNISNNPMRVITNPYTKSDFYFSPQLPLVTNHSAFTSAHTTPKTACSSRKINLAKFKSQERTAAIIIQSWWRKIRARKVYLAIKAEVEMKKAERKARKAVEEYEKLKRASERLRKNCKFNNF
ncbi:hypothetical protein SteCoe_25871 [Stentor coeruleus]|uniref:Uncharacterized protein n=1 Tax=Stentor coeruleus TaxID=5963 RepID=A0A1R2BE77_9CILI|nr:hypothetical protein SteCoe_25871 [Stentor coeruleus]